MEKQNLSIFNFSIFLLKILGFLVVFGLAFNYVFEKQVIFKSQISGAYKINRILHETEPDEIPVFGSSRAEGSFVPSIIDENCFNYGVSGTQSNIWLYFLEQELKKKKNAPIIINFDIGGLGYADGDIINYIPNWQSSKHVLNSDGAFYYNIPFVKYFGKFERYAKYYLNEKINLTKVTDNGASFEKNELTEDKFQELVKQRENYTSTFLNRKELLDKFNRLIASTDRKIVIVISPYHRSYFKKFTNIEDANQYLRDLNMRDNVTVLDLRNYIKEDKLFFNTTHLNHEGAILFSHELKELLATL